MKKGGTLRRVMKRMFQLSTPHGIKASKRVLLRKNT
jgi:hypothetical protein